MKKIGKKTREWIQTKPKLIKEYLEKGITKCEISGSRFMLDFHHIDKRSSQVAEHTFYATRLLNQDWHDFVEYNDKANEMLVNKPRGFDKEYYEKFKQMKNEKKEEHKSKKADWSRPHLCKNCKRQVSMLICSYCNKMSL